MLRRAAWRARHLLDAPSVSVRALATCVRGSALVAAAILVFGGFAFGQDPDLVLRVDDASGFSGTTIGTSVFFDNTSTDSVAGWTYGVCHDTGVLTITSAVSSSLVQTINAGMMPAFSSTQLLPNGAIQGIVIDIGTNRLFPGTGYEFLVLGYEAMDLTDMDPVTTTSVFVCDTLGSPPVDDLILTTHGLLTPTGLPGTITVYPFVPESELVAFGNSETVVVSGISLQPTRVSVGFGYRDPDPTLDGARDTRGFSMGVTNAGTYLSVVDLDPVGPLAAIHGGAGPAFFTTNLTPVGGPGWTVGVVYDLMGGVFVQFSPTGEVVVEAEYTVDSNSLVDPIDCMEQTVVEALTWSDGLGNPTVTNVVLVGSASLVAVASARHRFRLPRNSGFDQEFRETIKRTPSLVRINGDKTN
ncbi:MAG: hypothetical protein AB7O52_05605, partial [Planctomycetota bacterium]